MILAIDQGTTSTTCLVVTDELRVAGRGSVAIEQSFPRPGWVEHDPEELWRSVERAAGLALSDAGIPARALTGIGIANQRETALVWERSSGRPLAPAIVWQDRRTAARCAELPLELIRARTGLVPDPYFSATKLEWLLARASLPQSELAFGTVESWLVWRLSRGAAHVTDPTNASRTLLFDLDRGDWSDELLALFGVERELLADVVPSSALVAEGELLGARLPVAALAGDQQASLFGHGCVRPGEGKATYGTGSFVLVNGGARRPAAPDGLLVTAAAVAPGGAGQFALEGAVLAAGAAVQWLADGLGLLAEASESERLARSVASTGGVHFVPALAGLGSPHWDAEARGLICGLTRGTTRAELARATLEAIAFQVADVAEALPERLELLRADGGASANGFLMQFQADVLGCPVEVAADAETTALGAAALAGLALGVWPDVGALEPLRRTAARYEPHMAANEREERLAGWRLALRRALLR